MSNLSHESLLREIDEDLRRERYGELWRRFGIYIVAAIVALLVGVAGYQFWQYRIRSAHQDASARLLSATALVETDRAAAERELAALAGDGPAGLAVLAGLRQAALLAESGDVLAARAAYQQVQRTAGNPLYRDLAVVREAMLALQAEAVPLDADAIAAKLEPLKAEANPWRFSAQELSALLASRTGQIADARALLNGLVANQQVPPDMRERAQQLLTQLPQS